MAKCLGASSFDYRKEKRKEYFHEKHIFKSSRSCCFCRTSKLFSTTLDPQGACHEIRDVVHVLDAPQIPEQSRGHSVRYCNACDWPGRNRERARLALGSRAGPPLQPPFSFTP